MNYHFVSFLFDVVSWMGLSLFLGRVITDLENFDKSRKVKTSLILLLVALCSGCWSVMTHGLPDTGFAWFSLTTVGIVSFTQALFLSKELKRRTKDILIMLFSLASSLIKDVKGGVTYGNSR